MTTMDEWRAYAQSPQFKADLAEAARLIEAGDTEELAAFASRGVERRAAQAVARNMGLRP